MIQKLNLKLALFCLLAFAASFTSSAQSGPAIQGSDYISCTNGESWYSTTYSFSQMSGQSWNITGGTIEFRTRHEDGNGVIDSVLVRWQGPTAGSNQTSNGAVAFMNIFEQEPDPMSVTIGDGTAANPSISGPADVCILSVTSYSTPSASIPQLVTHWTVRDGEIMGTNSNGLGIDVLWGATGNPLVTVRQTEYWNQFGPEYLWPVYCEGYDVLPVTLHLPGILPGCSMGKTTDLNEAGKASKMSVGFDPQTTNFKIKYRGIEKDRVAIRVLDIQGKVVLNLFQGEIEAGSDQLWSVPADGLASGLYLVEAISKNGVPQVEKLLRP